MAAHLRHRRTSQAQAHISGTGAHSHLVRTGSGLNCSVDYFLFFEGPKGRYGPREAWAHMGWVGHPAH